MPAYRLVYIPAEYYKYQRQAQVDELPERPVFFDLGCVEQP
jgi:hypothetical protein